MGNGYSTKAEIDPYFEKGQNAYKAVMNQIVEPTVNSGEQFKRDLINGRTREPVAYLLARIEGPQRSGARYVPTRCSKYKRQVKNTYDQMLAQDAALLETPTTMSDSAIAQGATSSATPAATPAATAVVVSSGETEFKANCATSGCHASMPVRASTTPQRMISKAGITGDTELINQINKYLGSR
jgi:hypothetical protein